MCSGSGSKPIYRCAPSHLDHDTSQAIVAYCNHEKGILPGPGPWGAQTAVFARIVRIINGERAAIDDDRRRSEKARAQRRAR